jgi:hypothetical protein
MLAATVLAIFLVFSMDGVAFGEFMSDYVKKPIKTTIEDDDRRQLALHELSSLKRGIKDFNKGVSKDTKKLKKLVDDYVSTPEDFDNLFASAFSRRGQEMGEIWTRRQAMLRHIQANEWQEIMSSAKATAQAKGQ